MIQNIKIITLFLCMTALTGCIKDGEIPCPEGTIQIHFFAEKFQNKSQNPLDEREEKFCDRIGHIRYYLYKNGELQEKRIVENFSDVESNCYSLKYTGLEYGDYELVIVSNCTKEALSGDPVKASNLLLTYPGGPNTEDFFTAVFPFTVNSNESKEYEVGLLRAQGVVRYTFANMPSNITGVGIRLTNVGNEKWITGDYSNMCEATHHYTTLQTRQASNYGYVIGTFPTIPAERSAYYLSLYRDGSDTPYTTQMIVDTLSVIRNQLIDITTSFGEGGEITYEITLDNEWDGSILGGEVEVQ